MRGLVVGDLLDLDLLNNQAVFFSIFLQFVTHRPNNALYLTLEQGLQMANANVLRGCCCAIDNTAVSCQYRGVVLDKASSLIFKNGDNMCIVLPILFCALSIVEIDEHVSEALVQSIVNSSIVLTFLLLMSLLLLLLGLLVLLLLSTIVVSLVVLSWLSMLTISLLLATCSLAGLMACVLGSARKPVLNRSGFCWRPLMMLFFDLFTNIIFIAFFRTIDALFFRVFIILTLLFALFVISFTYAYVFSSCWLGLPCGTFRPRRVLMLLLLGTLVHLLLIRLPLLLVNKFMHRHNFLIVIIGGTLRVLGLVVMWVVPLRLIYGLLFHILLRFTRCGGSFFFCQAEAVGAMAAPAFVACLLLLLLLLLLDISRLRFCLFWHANFIIPAFYYNRMSEH